MRLVRLENINGDEILARHVLDADGRTLLSKGVRVKLSYLNRLKDLGISSIYIDDKISEDIEINDVLCDETRLHAKNIVQQEALRYLKGKEIDVQQIQNIVNSIIEDVLSSESELVNLRDIRIKDEYTFSHSVNVCVLSVLLSTKMGIAREKVNSIGSACLMHDFGKMLIPNEILNKPSKLTAKEFDEIKKHPLYGYNTLKDDHLVKSTTKVAVLMHHERLDGSGYPHGLKAKDIHYSAKICGICDVFDAMTSDRVYRNALSTSDAVEYLHSLSSIHFEKEYVSSLLSIVPIFPNGTVVLLNNGCIAIVVKNNKSNLLRPTLRLLYNTKTKKKYNNYIINLMEDLTLKIVREITLDKSFLD